MPVKDGKVLKDNEFQELPESEQKEYQERRESLQDDLKGAMKEMRKLENESQQKVRELDQNVALNVVGGTIEDLIDKYKEHRKVVQYLQKVQDDILENLDVLNRIPNSKKKKCQIPRQNNSWK